MAEALLTALIYLIIIGVVFYFVRRVVALIPMEPIIAQAIDLLILLCAVLVVLVYVVLPLLHMLGGHLRGF